MIQKGIILGLTLIAGILLMRLYTCTHSETHVSLFKGKTCFSFPPHATVEGMVIYRRDNYYIIMWRDEAERRYAGPKVGYKIGVKYLDMYASPVKCPSEWIEHQAGRKR